MNMPWTVLIPLVDKAPNPNDVKPGWIAFGIFLALCVAVVLLALSMRKHLKRVTFDEGGGRAGKRDDATRNGETTTDGDKP
jgi:hypothetical protein